MIHGITQVIQCITGTQVIQCIAQVIQCITQVKQCITRLKHFITQVNEISEPLNQMGTIFYLIDHTCTYPNNTGIQRVVRGLARSLMDNGVNLIPVRWADSRKQFYPASKKELKYMSRWNGPSVSQWSAWLEPEQATIRDWILVAELTHDQTSNILQFRLCTAKTIGVYSNSLGVCKSAPHSAKRSSIATFL